MKADYAAYEHLLSTYNPGDRAVIKSILDSEDIAYYFDSEYVAPYVYNAIPVRLMIRKDQMKEAREILKEFELSFICVSTKNPKDITYED